MGFYLQSDSSYYIDCFDFTAFKSVKNIFFLIDRGIKTAIVSALKYKAKWKKAGIKSIFYY